MPIKTRKVTPRMAEANRHNAKKSTGPRSPEGKQNVAYNALQARPVWQALPAVHAGHGRRP
jgi:hypothetical protein